MLWCKNYDRSKVYIVNIEVNFFLVIRHRRTRRRPEGSVGFGMKRIDRSWSWRHAKYFVPRNALHRGPIHVIFTS